MQNAFAIYHTWPNLRNAEYEVLQRVLGAARNIGCNVVVMDNSGRVLWSTPEMNIREGTELSPDRVDFAVSLHFESPRACDIYTYYALWQPIIFYEDFGYEKSLDKFSTHNDLLSCHSDIADNHALNIFNGIGRGPIEPLETLFHTLPEPFCEPNVTSESQLFYIGINWERIGKPKGRYHDLLVMLDKKELIKIYGPEEVHGVAPWGGFATYQGELPFDGHSIRDAINEAGICLALSSAAHRNTGIMSNRLFEGLAGGAAVIATPNPLIDKYFKDVVYEVDDSRGEGILGQEVQAALREIRLNPEKAMERVREGQRILREKCGLEASLKSIFDNNSARIQNFQSKVLLETEVTVILTFAAGNIIDLQERVADYSRQSFSKVHLHVLLDQNLADAVSIPLTGSLVSLTLHPLKLEGQPSSFDGRRPKPQRTGPVVAQILDEVKTPYVAFLTQADRIFSDHFASLAKAIAACPGALVGASGSLREEQDATGSVTRSLSEAKFEDIESLVLVDGPVERGRFLFATSLFEQGQGYVLHLLDGEEFRLFALAGALEGPIAQSNYATHIEDRTAAISIREPVESVELQRQYVRDYYRRDGRWIDRVSRGRRMPAFVHAYAPGAPIRWSNTLASGAQTKMLVADRTYFTRLGEPAVKCLVSGFSDPEGAAVWLAADRGVIEFSLPRGAAAVAEDYDIVLSLAGRRSVETGRLQHCTFTLNNVSVAYTALAEHFTEVRIRIPLNALHNTNVFRLEIAPDHAEQVVDSNGRVTDTRHLSLLLESITICRSDAGRVPSIQPDEKRYCVEGDPVVRAMFVGFYAPEGSHTWIAGTHAVLKFRVTEAMTHPVMRLTVAGRSSQDGESQKLFVAVGDRDAGEFAVSESLEMVEIACTPAEIANQVISVTLRARHAEPVVDEYGNLLDNRLLGVSIRDFGIFESKPANWADVRETVDAIVVSASVTPKKLIDTVKDAFGGGNR